MLLTLLKRHCRSWIFHVLDRRVMLRWRGKTKRLSVLLSKSSSHIVFLP